MLHRSFGLDCIRAVAISLVVLNHFFARIPSQYHAFWHYPMGIIGVELFFVLSGYLIGGILLRKGMENEHGFTWKVALDFWLRRWFRTLPNYFVYLIAFLIVTPGILQTPWRCFSFFVFGQNFAWPNPDFFHVSWSLCVEEWIYLLLPVLMLCIPSSGRQTGHQTLRKAFWAIVLVVMACTILRLLVRDDRNWDVGVRKVTIYRLDAIALGVALAWIQTVCPSVWRWIVARTWLGIVSGLMALGYMLLQLSRQQMQRTTGWTGFMNTNAYFPLLDVCAVFLVARATTLHLPGSTFFRLLVEKTSLWSYSLYMSHWLVIMLFLRLRSDGIATLSITECLLALIASLLLAWTTYTWVEQPFLRLRDRFVPR